MTRWTQKDIESKGLKVANSNHLKTRNPIATKQPASFALGRLKAGNMNKTEIAYSKHLETLKHAGEILWFEFEPMNLKLADKCFYKVDFLVLTKEMMLEVHEVKGYWTDDALVKIKTAAAKFPFKFMSARIIKGKWEFRIF